VERRGKRVLASGVFDLLHPGHLYYLTEAKEAGGEGAELIVVVASDQTARLQKGRDPILSENERLALVRALKPVDRAVLGYNEVDMGRIIRELQPDLIALGHDQDAVEERLKRIMEQEGLKVEIVRIGRYGKTDIDSSSKIRSRIAERLRL